LGVSAMLFDPEMIREVIEKMVRPILKAIWERIVFMQRFLFLVMDSIYRKKLRPTWMERRMNKMFPPSIVSRIEVCKASNKIPYC
jgi:hypothetical protein